MTELKITMRQPPRASSPGRASGGAHGRASAAWQGEQCVCSIGERQSGSGGAAAVKGCESNRYRSRPPLKGVRKGRVVVRAVAGVKDGEGDDVKVRRALGELGPVDGGHFLRRV